MVAQLACVVVAQLTGEAAPVLGTALSGEKVKLVVRRTAPEVLRALEDEPADIVLVDSSVEEDAFELLRAVHERWPGMPVLLVTEELSASSIASAIARGASDLLVRPLGSQQLLFSVRKALATTRTSAAAPPPPRMDADIVFGRSAAMQSLRTLLEQVAPTTSTVLVRGESGTGKELVARALHRLSPRARRPFIKIDCTSLPETLLESELFGYEKGAFTGASSQKLGRVQMADGGTLFLDEVGELSPAVQAKLLRLLQDRAFERLGGRETLSVDVRVVAATHRDLETMVERRSFRQDLFYRLNVVPVWIAPLRTRRADIPELAAHFCREASVAMGRPNLELGADALTMLAGQRWPGNVRQLQNFVERLVVLCRGSSISEHDVSAELAQPVRFATETGPAGADAPDVALERDGVLPLSEIVRAAERQALVRALERTRGNRSAAARLLGVCRATLYSKLGEHGLL
jgi:two-component system, NtrC family, response regulator AtoC